MTWKNEMKQDRKKTIITNEDGRKREKEQEMMKRQRIT